MRRKLFGVVAVGVLVGGLGDTSAGAAPDGPQAPAQTADDDHLDVYVGKVDLRELATLRAAGVDPHDLAATTAASAGSAGSSPNSSTRATR